MARIASPSPSDSVPTERRASRRRRMCPERGAARPRGSTGAATSGSSAAADSSDSRDGRAERPLEVGRHELDLGERIERVRTASASTGRRAWRRRRTSRVRDTARPRGSDDGGNLWLFGGEGRGSVASFDVALSDLWKWDGANWTWVSGPNVGQQPGRLRNERSGGAVERAQVPVARLRRGGTRAEASGFSAGVATHQQARETSC